MAFQKNEVYCMMTVIFLQVATGFVPLSFVICI